MTKSIINTKLYNRYGSYSNIAKELGRTTAYRISQGKLPCIYNISDICKSINYTFEEFKADYADFLYKFLDSNYYLIYKIYINGFNFSEYVLKIEISKSSLKYLFKENKTKINPIIFWKLNWIINKDKLPFESNIDFIKKDGYAKIIGNRDTLEKLKELYSIPYPVLFYSNDLWHIAFWWI